MNRHAAVSEHSWELQALRANHTACRELNGFQKAVLKSTVTMTSHRMTCCNFSASPIRRKVTTNKWKVGTEQSMHVIRRLHFRGNCHALLKLLFVHFTSRPTNIFIFLRTQTEHEGWQAESKRAQSVRVICLLSSWLVAVVISYHFTEFETCDLTSCRMQLQNSNCH